MKGFSCQIPPLGKSVVNLETSEIARFMVKYRPPIQLELIKTLYKNQSREKCQSVSERPTILNEITIIFNGLLAMRCPR